MSLGIGSAAAAAVVVLPVGSAPGKLKAMARERRRLEAVAHNSEDDSINAGPWHDFFAHEDAMAAAPIQSKADALEKVRLLQIVIDEERVPVGFDRKILGQLSSWLEAL